MKSQQAYSTHLCAVMLVGLPLINSLISRMLVHMRSNLTPNIFM
jgi:hypothetical protein